MAKRKPEPSLFDDSPDESIPASPAPPPSPPSTGRGSGSGMSGDGSGAVALHDAAQSRYLNYALSVITSRALPDVRDGLKPVQRRILYTMWQQNLDRRRQAPQVRQGRRRRDGQLSPARRRGDLRDAGAHGAALLAALSARRRLGQLRLARRRSARRPCATPSAAWRAIADEMLQEIDQETVPFRPNYDGTKTEPVVLPSRFPNLLVNGATGIAVGMATNIPPHNLTEVCQALIKLLDNPDLSAGAAVPVGQGPGFPDRRPDPQLRRGDEARSTSTGQRRHQAARHLGSRPGRPRREDHLRHQHPLHDRQERSGAADRRRRPVAQAAAAGRRQGSLHRRRPHRTRAQARRRREAWSWRTCSSTRRCRPTSPST